MANSVYFYPIEMTDDSPCLELLASADDDTGLGPQQLRIYGEQALLDLARACMRAVRGSSVEPPEGGELLDDL